MILSVKQRVTNNKIFEYICIFFYKSLCVSYSNSFLIWIYRYSFVSKSYAWNGVEHESTRNKCLNSIWKPLNAVETSWNQYIKIMLWRIYEYFNFCILFNTNIYLYLYCFVFLFEYSQIFVCIVFSYGYICIFICIVFLIWLYSDIRF